MIGPVKLVERCPHCGGEYAILEEYVEDGTYYGIWGCSICGAERRKRLASIKHPWTKMEVDGVERIVFVDVAQVAINASRDIEKMKNDIEQIKSELSEMKFRNQFKE